MAEAQVHIDPRLVSQLYKSGQEDNLIKFQLDATEYVEKLKYELLGYTWDDDKDNYIRDNSKMQMMNEEGANVLLTFIRARITKIISLSKHDSQDIDARCLRFIDNLSIMITRHGKQWKIPSFAIMDNIIDLCDDIYRATARKSLDGWEGDSIRKAHQTVESKETIIDHRKQQGGIMGNFPLQFRRRRK